MIEPNTKPSQEPIDSFEMLQALVASSHDHIFMLDLNGAYLMSNDRVSQFGLEKGDSLVGRHFREVYPPEILGLYQEKFKAVLETGRAVDFEHAMPGTDGEHVHHDTLYPVCRDGALRAVGGICRDITEKSRTEQQLRSQKERLEILFENAPDGCYLNDMNGVFVDGNRAAEALLGYRKEEVVGRSFFDLNLLPPDQLPKAVELLAKNQSGRPTGPDELILNRKDSRRLAVEIRTYPVTIEGRNLVLGIARDLTARKQEQEKRREAEEALRTNQEQLVQAQKLEALGTLAGGIAHDFDNLLTAIMGYTELLLDGVTTDHPMAADLDEIRRAAFRATTLTRQLLTFSRRQVLQPEVLNLNAVTEETKKMLRRLIGENISLVTNLAEDLGNVKVDPGQIEQVIMNLAVNGRDAMPDGGRLTLETANVYGGHESSRIRDGVEPGSFVRLTVKDNGHGMDERTRERIFEPFFTTKERGRGTGLGLSTVYGIVKQSNGHIWIDSEVGKGTTIEIYLPQVQERAAPPRPSRRQKPVPRGSETILLVEDDDTIRHVLGRLLSQKGYIVLESGDGEEAVQMSRSRKEPIDLLVSDVVLPGMNGHSLGEHFARYQPTMKIVYMSGHPDNEVVQNNIVGAKAHFINKPFSALSFLDKIRSVLDGV